MPHPQLMHLKFGRPLADSVGSINLLTYLMLINGSSHIIAVNRFGLIQYIIKTVRTRWLTTKSTNI